MLRPIVKALLQGRQIFKFGLCPSEWFALFFSPTILIQNRSTQFEKNFAHIPIFGIFDINRIKMNKNTSISLGNYFDQFVQSSISEGRFKNVSEVIRAGLRLLEEEESKVIALKKAIQEGIDSGIADDFDPKKHLESLKAKKHSNG